MEAVLNSRPLTPLSDDPTDCQALTPAHFLIQGGLHVAPEEDLIQCKPHYLRRWQLVQQMAQNLWSRWSKEYVTRLQNRPKWWRSQPDLAPGRLVLIADDNLPPLKWRLGRIKDLHTGEDGHTRVVTLHTARGDLTRPIVKLCPLPLDTAETAT